MATRAVGLWSPAGLLLALPQDPWAGVSTSLSPVVQFGSHFSLREAHHFHQR